MPKRKSASLIPKVDSSSVEGLHAEVIKQEIVDTLEVNYMPYAMSVIVSRAIPEIDGFKPSHRKLLYTMYKMNLLTGNRTKSANIVGQTMRLNPHGDSAIYETMVRLSKGNEALLTPFVDSKGNFGKVYSRDMSYAASRYTEAKLSDISAELFRDLDKDAVDFVDNYDGTMKEPALLPTVFPNILVSSNTGIAVGMASQICGFNLNEVCQTTIDLIKNPKHDITKTLLAPDFTTGGELIYDIAEIKSIYETGRGSFKVRARWRYNKENNIIEVYEIPYSTTVEAIIDKVAELLKGGRIREISDMRDETDLSGLKIAIDLKRGTNPDALMQKLFKLTTLQDTYSCNFNILVDGTPRVLGVREILNEWISWRRNCVVRRVTFDLNKKSDRLHLLQGLQKILVDIDKAIKIIRNTENESDVVPNLMIGFGIDETQADYVAEIKLRNINKEYILKRVADIEQIEQEIEDLESTLHDPAKLKNIIVHELKQIIKKYPTPRRTTIVHQHEVDILEEVEEVPDYNVNLVLTREGYFKKISLQSWAASSEQKLKENDEILSTLSARNRDDVMFFTDKQHVYIGHLSEFDDTRASAMGVYLPSHFEMDDSESVVAMINPGDYLSDLLLFFENGKGARVPLSVYATKNRRRKLTGAYSDKSTIKEVIVLPSEVDLVVQTTDGRAMIFNTVLMQQKLSRTTQGVTVITLKKGAKLTSVRRYVDFPLKNKSRYKAKNLASTGAILKAADIPTEVES